MSKDNPRMDPTNQNNDILLPAAAIVISLKPTTPVLSTLKTTVEKIIFSTLK